MAAKHTKPLFKKRRQRKKQKWQNLSKWFIVLLQNKNPKENISLSGFSMPETGVEPVRSITSAGF